MEYSVNAKQEKNGVKSFDHYFLQWFTAPPTEPGWYWTYTEGWEEQTVLEVLKDQNGCYIYSIDDRTGARNRLAIERTNITNWLGPLPIPKVPKDL